MLSKVSIRWLINTIHLWYECTVDLPLCADKVLCPRLSSVCYLQYKIQVQGNMNVQWNFRERVTRNSHCLFAHLLRPSVHACHMLCHRSTRVTATRISIPSVCCLQYKILNQVEGVLYMYMYSCVSFHTIKVTMNNHIFLKRRQA